MNQSLVDLLTDDQTANLLVTGLPEAFEIVGANFLTDNHAIGILREQILIGFLRASFGGRRVKVGDGGVQRGYDLYVDG